MGYHLEGQLLSARVRASREGKAFGVVEVMSADERGHWVVPVYCDPEQVEQLRDRVGEVVSLPVRVYASGGSVRTVMVNG